MPRFLPWLVACAAIAGLGLSLAAYRRQGLALEAARAQIAQADQRTLRLAHDQQRRLVADRDAKAAADKLPNGAVNSSSAPAQIGYSHSDMRKDPRFAWISRKEDLRAVNRRYGDAFSAMKLSPEVLSKLRDLLVARLEAGSDAQDAGQLAGLSPTEIATAQKQATDSFANEIKTLVGANEYKQLDSTPQLGVFRSAIQNSVGIDLNAVGAPLTDEQVDALASSYSGVAAIAAFKGHIGTQIPDPQTRLTPFYQAILDRVTPLLSPVQVPVVRDYLIEQTETQRYYAENAGGK